jgi:hypothetical protein
MMNWRRESIAMHCLAPGEARLNCRYDLVLYAVPFKHFEDFSAADALAAAQEVAELGHGCLQGVKARRRFGKSIEPSVVVAIVAVLWGIEHFGVFSSRYENFREQRKIPGRPTA